MTTTPRGKTTAKSNEGSFKGHDHTTPEVGLTGQTEGVRVVSTRVRWTEPDVLPTPRHKVPRPVERELDIELEFREVTGEQAPVGLIVEHDEYGRSDNNERTHAELRVFDGRLYEAVYPRAARGETVTEPLDATDENLISLSISRGWYDERLPHVDGNRPYEVMANAQEGADDFLIVDGQLWHKTHEPIYIVRTYGLGHNHGGTGLVLESTVRLGSDGENEHAAPDDYFPVDQFEEARAAAIKTATDRGDTDSIESLKSEKPRVKLTGAFTPGTTWRPAPRLKTELPDYFERDKMTHDERFARFEEVNRELVSLGFVSETPDGFGGTRKHVDLNALSPLQAHDYEELRDSL